jgi:hypothetical protein
MPTSPAELDNAAIEMQIRNFLVSTSLVKSYHSVELNCYIPAYIIKVQNKIRSLRDGGIFIPSCVPNYIIGYSCIMFKKGKWGENQ